MEKYLKYLPFILICSMIPVAFFNPFTNMDINTLALTFLSTIGILAGIIFNPKLYKIERSIDDYQKENKRQHDDISVTLKKLVAVRDLEVSLREIIDSILEVTDSHLSSFINQEGQLFIQFVHEIQNGAFDVTALPSIRTKIFKLKSDSNKLATMLGSKFEERHKISQSHCVDKFYNQLEETLMDDIFNSKNKRFRMICEQFLHAHLTDSAKTYMSLRPAL